MPGISAVSPPISAQPACRQPSAMPAITERAVATSSLPHGEVVEEEQRLGPLRQQVVDAHGDQIDADRGVLAGIDGDLQLGADPVIGGDQDRVLEASPLQVEQGPEAAEVDIRAGTPRGAGQRLDGLHQGVAGIDVDTGIAVGDGRTVVAR